MLAGRLKKAFKALAIHDYFKARELFYKEIRKHPAAAWYGLSVITGRADNPFYQLDSSFACIQRADIAFTLLPGKQRSVLQGSGVDASAILLQKEHVYSIAWDQVRAVNSIQGYQGFIERYAGSSHVPEAVAARDALAFQEARAQDRAEGYRRFLESHPGAAETYEARTRMQEAVFREATPDGTLVEYERFIAEHPQSPYVANAHKEIYRISVPQGTPEERYAFIRRHPNSPLVAEAWRSIYEDRTKDLSAGSITRFLKEYPDYPYVEELSVAFETANLDLLPFRREGKWGFIDTKGVERIKAEYDFADPFDGGQAQVGMNGLVGTVNKSGDLVVPTDFDDVLGFSEGLATVERGDQAGVVDRSGRLIVGLGYEEIGEFNEGLAYARKDGKYGYLDAKGNRAITFIYDGANTFLSGVAVVEKEGLSGVIDTRGAQVVPFQYDWIEGFTGAVSRVRKDGRMGIISPFGDVLLPIEHDHVGSFSEGLAIVADGGKCGYVDITGRSILPQRYEMPDGAPSAWGDFHNGAARVVVGGKIGLIDVRGEFLVPAKYADIGLPEDRSVAVKKKVKWTFLSWKGGTLTDKEYDGVWEMHEGYARVRIDGSFGLVDSLARPVLPVKFPELGDVRHGLLIAAERSAAGGSKWGVIDVTGKVRIPLVFDRVEFVDDAVVAVGRGSGERLTDMRMAYMRVADGQYIWKEAGFDAEP